MKYFSILAIFIFQGCAYSICRTKTEKAAATVVLLNNGKTHNAVQVSTDKGAISLDKVRAYSDLINKNQAPTPPKIMSKKELKRRMGSVLSISVPKPLSYMLYFKKGKMELTSSSEKKITEIVASIINRVPCIVDVIGRTDTVGVREENIQTSFNQASYVESILQKEILKTITSKKDITLKTKGYGEEDLLIPTADNKEEERNRSVEVFIK